MTSADCPQRPGLHAASPHHPRTEDGRDPGRGAGGALRQDHSAGRCPQLSHCIFTMLQSDPIFSADPASASAARARPRPSGGLQAGRGPQAQTSGTHQDEDKGQRRGAGEIFFYISSKIFHGKSRSHSYFITLQVRPCQVCGEVAGRHSYYGGEVWKYDTVINDDDENII